MHPRDEADALRCRVGFETHLRDRVWPRERRLAHHANWQLVTDTRRNFAGVLRDLVQRLLTVQLLTTGQEPDLFGACSAHVPPALIMPPRSRSRGREWPSSPRCQGRFWWSRQRPCLAP